MNVADKLAQGMTVRELMDELSAYNEDAIVVFACDYGDHCHTLQALPINSVDELGDRVIDKSAYSLSGLEIAEDDMDNRSYINDHKLSETVILETK